ncbi:MAG: hypothetical protein JSS66_05740 [Armatimonadetes bacterium]|nr:hypothetical protein [Armatimonadota bacterium]
MRLYHGTFETHLQATDLQAFHPGRLGLGTGVYFGLERATAEVYGTHIIEAEVDIKNPLLIDPEEPLRIIDGNIQVALRTYEDQPSITALETFYPFDIIAHDGEVYEVRSLSCLGGLADWAAEKGYDAVIMRYMRSSGNCEEVVVWDTSKIKAPDA